MLGVMMEVVLVLDTRPDPRFLGECFVRALGQLAGQPAGLIEAARACPRGRRAREPAGSQPLEFERRLNARGYYPSPRGLMHP